MYRKRRVAVVVLARAGSRRLPGKVLLPLGAGTVLSSAIERLSACRWVDDVVLATSDGAGDDALARAGEELGVRVVRGSEQDVVARMRQAVGELELPPDVIVRGCADNPLVMPGVVDEAIMDLVDTESELITPFEFASYPFGFGAVVMTSACLARIDREAGAALYREHVENFCFEAPTPFRLRYLLAPLDLDQPELCASLDHPVDYARLRTYADWLRGVPLEQQPAALLCRLREARVWYEGHSSEGGLDWDLIVACDPEPLRSLASSVPLGVVRVDRFQVDGCERYGLRYLEDCGAAFPRGPIFLDWRREVAGETPRAFLARVRPLVWRLLLCGPLRALEAQEASAARPDKALWRERRAGFRCARDEAFPPRIVLALDGSWQEPELVRRTCAELRREPFEELVVRTPPNARERALVALRAALGPQRVRPAAQGEPEPEEPFQTLAIGACGQMSIVARGPSANLFDTGIAAFWRSPGARRARTHCLNAEQVLAREVWGR